MNMPPERYEFRLNNGRHVGGGKSEPSSIINFWRTVGDLDTMGDKTTLVSEKSESHPQDSSIGRGGGASASEKPMR